jgi:DNA-binding NtrC family response regulator
MANPPEPSGPRVLVVDDDADVAETMAYMLQKRGFRVLTAANAATAVEICREQGTAIDALVADLSLPDDLQGDFARRIAALHPHIKVVFVTGIPRHIAVTMGLVPPQAPYVEKPADMDMLSGLIRSMLP